MYACVCMHMFAMVHGTCGCQRTTIGSWFLSCTLLRQGLYCFCCCTHYSKVASQGFSCLRLPYYPRNAEICATASRFLYRLQGLKSHQTVWQVLSHAEPSSRAPILFSFLYFAKDFNTRIHTYI